MKSTRTSLLTVALFAAAVGLAPRPAAAVDAEAAKELMKVNQCNKCHSLDKDKSGPSLKKIATKYKGKADGEQAIIKNVTTAPKVKLDDGTEEEHKVIKTKDEAQLKNLAQWILAQ
jgi:cytochrome c